MPDDSWKLVLYIRSLRPLTNQEQTQQAQTTASAHYVGSQACAKCHEQIHEHWQRTPMANIVRDLASTRMRSFQLSLPTTCPSFQRTRSRSSMAAFGSSVISQKSVMITFHCRCSGRFRTTNGASM
jgi:hypothetical protein